MPSADTLALIDIAQSILERGAWTLPTWSVEEWLAEKIQEELGWLVQQDSASGGSLSFKVVSARPDSHFQNALVTGRWPCEVQAGAEHEIWKHYEGEQPGSEAERCFFYEVLVPVLGFPLLDYLRLQPALLTLGLDPQTFGSQRADFSLDTGRGLKLLIEVDGGQHNERSQHLLDVKRDKALEAQGWTIWRVPTHLLTAPAALREQLKSLLSARPGRTDWGVEPRISTPRSTELLTCVWGATAVARIQFLVLEALRQGALDWRTSWKIAVDEADTAVAGEALNDLQSWFGSLCELFGHSRPHGITYVAETGLDCEADLLVDVSIIQPHKACPDRDMPVARSRPANFVGPTPKRRFSKRLLARERPTADVLEPFVQDFLRKSTLREGQLEIIGRILTGEDVIGLLPTGGGKSLTYQLCGLLLGGLTIYVSPLKSLLQDQRERFLALGVDLAHEISSALTPAAKLQASQLLAAGGIRFLLIAPERLLIEDFRQQLAQFRAQFGDVSQVVIDECHCVSEWGHDFRPAYLSLGRIVKDRTVRLGVSAPLVALTGTASSVVLADVKRELGILNDDASVRARRLDRPEISMLCRKVRNNEKGLALQQLGQDFIASSTAPTDGMLIFTRFVGGKDGVLGLSARMAEITPQSNLRFYSGSEPQWGKFAAYATKRKVADLSAGEDMPLWALSPEGSPLQWEQVKQKTQSDFISGLPGNYQILVATSAFGMGIDKPSIRCVVHYLTPQSPEAYYQEVGRAGRDKQPSVAVLLFSDENPDVTDRILDPGASLEEARQAYSDFIEKSRFGGGDFIRTFYFHQYSFLGPKPEEMSLVWVLQEVRDLVAADRSLIIEYLPDDGSHGQPKGSRGQTERMVEYAIVRLILLGVVHDYTKEYNKQQFTLRLEPAWERICNDPGSLAVYYAGRFRQYAYRYQTYMKVAGEESILSATTIETVELATAHAIVGFVYEQIERKRRQASRQMLEFARVGASDPELFRERLNHYLQASDRFTKALESVAQEHDVESWFELLSSVDSVDEMDELHGACQRVLESFPTHPGLLCISATTRRNRNGDDVKRSTEEFQAALRYTLEIGGMQDAVSLGNAVASHASDRGETLEGALHDVLGVWLLTHGRGEEALARFFDRPIVRERWVAMTLREASLSVPEVPEI